MFSARFINKAFVLGLSLIVTFNVSASNKPNLLEIKYADFYSHLRKLDKETLTELRFSFGLIDAQIEPCVIEQGIIITDKKKIPINIQDNNRFVLPTERALKLAKAMVNLELAHSTTDCNLSVLIEIEPVLLKESLTRDKLLRFYASFKQFFEDMGGMFSFLMPEPSGLLVTSESHTELQILSSKYSALVNGSSIELPLSLINQLTNEDLASLSVVQVSALMPK